MMCDVWITLVLALCCPSVLLCTCLCLPGLHLSCLSLFLLAAFACVAAGNLSNARRMYVVFFVPGTAAACCTLWYVHTIPDTAAAAVVPTSTYLYSSLEDYRYQVPGTS